MPVRIKRPVRKKKSLLSFKKRTCRFCSGRVKGIDYKDVKLLENFIRERGKIVSSRISGNCAKHQRRLAEAVKCARFISLIPYTKV
ncbi:MAG: 30S ribosomal protein S18 [Candidatus Omnitrophica bacterium]|jgi:small subunit ribosomal protein S18|nr:30S ribosomal protein S18 [Candidatus Omnitrophota bacterium]MDD5513102.1 30S ribosomal protein S18 [Candidatus Omnitrophota bacterium]